MGHQEGKISTRSGDQICKFLQELEKLFQEHDSLQKKFGVHLEFRKKPKLTANLVWIEERMEPYRKRTQEYLGKVKPQGITWSIQPAD